MSAKLHEREAPAPSATLHRILLAERDAESLQMLRSSLTAAGFVVTVLDANEDALLAMDRDQPDLVMLDWEHPLFAADSVVRRIRRDAALEHTRLIALSMRSGEHEIVSGLELGVDDYVVRPYSMPLLLARVRAVLRSGRLPIEEPNMLRFRLLQLDRTDRRLMIGTASVALRPMEYRLIEFLMRHPERVFTRRQMLRSGIWRGGSSTNLRSLDVTVQRARKALALHDCGDYLQTVRAVGYRLSALPSAPECSS